METNKCIWDDFTNKYSLSKTLRFELKPIGIDGKQLSQEDATKVFTQIIEQDKKIKEAYIVLKPILDRIHEQVINLSLNSEDAKKIDFLRYYERYSDKRELKSAEDTLRREIVKTFNVGVKSIKEKAGKDNKGKQILKEEGIKCLTEAGILKYIERNIKDFISDKLTEKELKDHLEVFNKFFGYFLGYNQNRKNYYVTEEKATAVATRIVRDNLPKFCDNCIQFSFYKIIKKKDKDKTNEVSSRKDEYLNVYQFLKDSHKTTKIKDAETNQMIEAEPIDKKLFDISTFSECMSQSGIEKYNKIIGHYNLLLNLYNQARKGEKDFKKLNQFKTLYKQIGCGKKKVLFDSLKYDTPEEQKKANEELDKILNLKEILVIISDVGKKYFKQDSDGTDSVTIIHFINWLKENENWDGVYWSKGAVDKISNQYLTNWNEIQNQIKEYLQGKDKALKEKCHTIATFDKIKDQLKINDAVELSVLFEILDTNKDKDWKDYFFKKSILDNDVYLKLINENLPPSKNLINLICEDMKISAEKFYELSKNILEITDYKKDENKLKIKDWLELAKQVVWHIKDFEVKENKVKGNPINSEFSNMITILLHTDDIKWFDWYDVVRNYLTKKPQDDAKKNKLKLNFKNAHLLGGLSDGEEKNKGAVIIRNNKKYYLGLLIKSSIFDTSLENNHMYNNTSENTGRVIIKNLGFKTLAGKGFKSKFGESYGEIGKRNPMEAVEKLQIFLREHATYIVDYPLLKEVVNKKYTTKKEFDKRIKEILIESYQCYFKPINWNNVLQNIMFKNLYLFEIYSKDFSEIKGEKSRNSKVNLQTIYWEHIFQKNSNIQLCGGGELFFRNKAIEDGKIIIHSANQPIQRRIGRKTESRFSHSIIKDKRFTMEKFFLHIPIMLNYQTTVSSFINSKVNLGLYSEMNNTINNVFTQTNNVKFLGIDRGEKHLIYYSLVDINGNILAQDDFDEINNKNYLCAINEAIKIGREKQENWQQKGNIKNLKDGYMSLVIHEIIQKIKDQNNGIFTPTYIVLENLNKGFKRSRQKFEQQVYQKFELALAKKLNYLVDKTVIIPEIGSISNALQLTPPVANYQDIENKKQVGVMLYTRAQYTSITDPVTGWRKTIYITGNDEDIKKQIFENFSNIMMDENGDYFFEYIDKNTKKWKLWSSKDGCGLERYRTKHNKDKNEIIILPYNPKEMLDKLFAEFDLKKSLLDQLKNGVVLSKIDNDKSAWKSLCFVIDIIQQIRNNGNLKKKQDDNFLLSPIRNEQGEHFDSRITYQPIMPKDADANGAYNIARKGIIMYEHIKQWIKEDNQKDKKYSDLDLFISDNEWDLWLCDKDIWKKKLPIFASRKSKLEE